ncbi:MAG: thymidine phosphorylase [Gemmatimonadetes bacterium]|nr:thymidine phosphorylase [Gemmatimonadota bacterium]
MVVPRLIERKRDGAALGGDEWRALISHYAAGGVPDYQMAALCMAVVFRGLEPAELVALTDAMRDSGASLPRGTGTLPRIDKHSTGGVGDTTSLILAPLLAACGVAVPMMSGRGLGHTGGTLDKLEAIPGYTIHMDNARFLGLVEECGCAIVGQSGAIAPADGRIYALRDVTGTVDCVPLITASIMSKKLAAGPRTIVIDLKTGSGAFMRDLAKARELATALVAVGQAYGRRMSVIFSDMDQPLGRAIGHANETLEAFAALRPGHRATAPADLVALTEDLVADMVRVAGLAPDHPSALAVVREAWDSGAAHDRMLAWVAAQGGRLDPARDDYGLTVAPVAHELVADRDAWLAGTDCRQIGLALADMGGARRRVEDPLDLAAGITFHPAIGDRLRVGDPVATFHAADAGKAQGAASRVAAALSWSDTAVPARDLVLDRLE